MRYVIIGVGAVGGTIGARLALAGSDVAFVARGAHGAAIASRGLRFLTPTSDDIVRVPTVQRVDQLAFRADDIVMLATKSQDTDGALSALEAVAPLALPIVCAQNGVENERRALRIFPNVHGMCVFTQGEFLEDGVVSSYGRNYSAFLDVGRYPRGRDDVDETIARDAARAGMACDVLEDVMQVKYAKLLTNLGNVVEAASGSSAWNSTLTKIARSEARACFAAAGIVAGDGGAMHVDLTMDPGPIGDRRRGGGSTWQSLARGAASLETDALNGEIVLLGRLHAIPTPANEFLYALGRRLLHERTPAGSVPLADLEREFSRG